MPGSASKDGRPVRYRLMLEVDADSWQELADRAAKMVRYIRAGHQDHVDNGDVDASVTHEYHIYELG